MNTHGTAVLYSFAYGDKRGSIYRKHDCLTGNSIQIPRSGDLFSFYSIRIDEKYINSITDVDIVTTNFILFTIPFKILLALSKKLVIDNIYEIIFPINLLFDKDNEIPILCLPFQNITLNIKTRNNAIVPFTLILKLIMIEGNDRFVLAGSRFDKFIREISTISFHKKNRVEIELIRSTGVLLYLDRKPDNISFRLGKRNDDNYTILEYDKFLIEQLCPVIYSDREELNEKADIAHEILNNRGKVFSKKLVNLIFSFVPSKICMWYL